MLFYAYVIQTILCGVEVWGDNISASKWNDLEKLQKAFLRCHLGVKTTTPYSLLILETGRRQIEFHALIRAMRCIVQVQQIHANRLRRRAWEASIKLQKNYKSKVTNGM